MIFLPILKKSGLVVISILISMLIFYYFIDDLVVNFIATLPYSGIVFIYLRLLGAVFIYNLFFWIKDKNIPKLSLNLMFILYFGFILVSTLIARKHSEIYATNVNILNIFRQNPLNVFINIIIYIPLGIYLKLIANHIKNIFWFILFLSYISIIELLQYTTRRGFFDINDIILNFIGFTVGIYALKHVSQSKQCTKR